MASVSVAIMAHPRRSAFIPELQAQLDRPATVVWDDGSNSRWGTGRRALLAYDPDADFHLVLQDDAVIPRDLVAGLEAALQHASEDVPVCLYVGRVRPYREMVTEYVGRARDASWLVMDRINWGVAIAFPTNIIDELVAYCDTQTIPNYDSRMSKWFENKGIPVWYPFPSLVDHRESPSLVPGRGHAGRVAHRFIGADTSALDIDYSGAVLRLPNANDYRPGGQTNMLFYCDIPNYSLPAANVRFKDHYFEAQTAGQVTTLQMPHVKRRGVRPATEGETAAWYGTPTEISEPAPVEAPGETVEIQEPAPVVAPEETEPVEETVPDGTADEIMEWVGTDTERALAAIEAEEARERPRKTLLAKLEAL